MRIGRPRTLLSLTLMGLGLVTLPLLYAVANAVFELDDLMNESLEVAQASAVTAREGQRIETALENMLRHAQSAIRPGSSSTGSNPSAWPRALRRSRPSLTCRASTRISSASGRYSGPSKPSCSTRRPRKLSSSRA